MTTVQRIPTTTKYLNELTPHPENYNSHPASQIKELAESLSTFGQFKNIVCWTCPENMTTPEGHELHEGLIYILAGHGLWLASMEAGIDELEVKDYSGLSYEMALGLLLVDNAAPSGSVPIVAALASLLERAREPMADKPRLTAMLERLRVEAGINGNGQNGNGAEPTMPTETEAERLAKQWETAPGQVWQLGRHIIACLDSTDEAAVRELIGGKSVGMVWADPPYGMGLDTDYSQMATWANKQVGGKYEGFRRKGGSSKSQTYDSVIGDNQTFDPTFIFERFGYADELFLWGADYYAEKIPDRNKGAWLVWDKRSDSQGGNVDEMFGSAFELCWSKRPHKRDLIRVRWAGYFGTETQDIKRRVHPNQKPLQLPEQIFATHGKPDDLIFDPFLGSGISVLAAEKLNDGRRVIGCELAPEYIAVTIHRFVQMTGQQPKQLTGQAPRRAAS